MNAVLYTFMHACILLYEIIAHPVAFLLASIPVSIESRFFPRHYNDRGCQTTNGGTF